MIKDQAVGKLLRLVVRCDASTVVRLANELEDALEIGPYGVRHLQTGDGPILAEHVMQADRLENIGEPISSMS